MIAAIGVEQPLGKRRGQREDRGRLSAVAFWAFMAAACCRSASQFGQKFGSLEVAW